MFKLIENIFKGMCLWVRALVLECLFLFGVVHLYRRNSFLNAT